MPLIEGRSLNYRRTIVYHEPISSSIFVRPSVNFPSLYPSHSFSALPLVGMKGFRLSYKVLYSPISVLSQIFYVRQT